MQVKYNAECSSTFDDLSYHVIKIFILSIFEWLFYTDLLYHQTILSDETLHKDRYNNPK